MCSGRPFKGFHLGSIWVDLLEEAAFEGIIETLKVRQQVGLLRSCGAGQPYRYIPGRITAQAKIVEVGQQRVWLTWRAPE